MDSPSAWPTFTAETFRQNRGGTERLRELLLDPVMQEALLIIQSRLNAVLPTTIESAALNGAYAAGAKSVIDSLYKLSEYDEATLTSDQLLSTATAERNAWIKALNPNNSNN